MKWGGRAIVESLVLHGLLFGAMIAMAKSLTPPPPIRLDFCMLVTKGAKSTSPVVAKTPVPPMVKPTPSAPRPKPAVSTRPQKSKHVAVKPPPSPHDSGTPDQATATALSTAAPVGNNQGRASHPAAGEVDTLEEYRHANLGAIRSAILANLRYPLQARRHGWSGLVEVAFLVTPDGNVSDLRVQASSGFPVLDDQALAAVRRSAPFTPPRIAALLVMPVTFRLN